MTNPLADPDGRDVLDALLRPASVALVGVARPAPGKSRVGGLAVLHNLRSARYAGAVYVVHPSADEIDGTRCYRSLADLPEAPDTVVVSLPAAAVPGVAAECGQVGARSLVIMTAGFGELGTEDGIALERELADVARKYGLAICGPNGLGLVNVALGAMLGNFPTLELGPPPAGGLAIVSHSGAIAGSVMARARDLDVGLSYVISSGNETATSVADYVRALSYDDHVNAISLYLEGVVDGRDLVDALTRATSAGKIVVAYKVGESEVGARAALSHTAKVAGKPELYAGAFAQAGVVQARSLEELVQIPAYFAGKNARPTPPHRACIISISGGLGAVTADELSRHGIEVPLLGADTQAAIETLRLPLGGASNPIDTSASTQRGANVFAQLIEIVDRDPDIDVIVVPIPSRFGTSASETPPQLIEALDRTSKPLVTYWYAGAENAEAKAALRASGIPCFDDVYYCARAITAASSVLRWSTSPRLPAPVGGAAPSGPPLPPGGGTLSEPDGKALLRSYGIESPKEAVARSSTEAVEVAGEVGYPVAVKVVSRDITHKAAVGGVRLAVDDSDELAAAYDDVIARVSAAVPSARVDGVLITEMVSPQAELLLGAFEDETFGPVIALGRGGSRVEQLRDVHMRLLPLPAPDCAQLVRDLVESTPEIGLDAMRLEGVTGAVHSVARLAWECRDRLVELDVNPLVVTSDGRALALDSVVVLRDTGSADSRGGGKR